MDRRVWCLVTLMGAACGDDGSGAVDMTIPVDGRDAGTDAFVAVPDAMANPDLAPADSGRPDGFAPDSRLETFTTAAAAAVCDLLFRCCDGAAVERFFAPHRDSPVYESVADRLPPTTPLDAAGCPALVRDMMALSPFGDWVAQAQAGRVDFDGEAMDACLMSAASAECGGEARAALYDSTCFALGAPAGGTEQRATFRRRGSVGDACHPIRDGIGAVFYGTCDPTTAFCCYEDPTNPELGCTFPYDGDGVPREGVCRPAHAAEATCAIIPPLQLCQTGLDCDDEAGRCVAPVEASLEVGEPCIDDDFFLLGECTDSWCDLFGSKVCEPRKDNGEACTGGGECLSEACVEGLCGESVFCVGAPPDMGGADMGPPDMADMGPPDMGSPDMGALAAESCTSAVDLLTVSSPLASGPFQYELTSSYGTRDDHNPYMAPGNEPGCSVVYDAVGAERAYEVRLEPGQTLSLSLAPSPAGSAGAVYLLDGCEPATWPDYDESGACGSNEYGVQGFCTAWSCDPVEWTWSYPTAVGGAPTSARTFVLVVDSLAAGATDFTLRWRID